LLALAVRAAAERGGEPVALTFDPHPTAVLAPDRAPPLICSRARKLELLASRGISAAVVEPFTPQLAAMSPADFVSGVLAGALGARAVVVGYDFTYGNRAAGDTDSLRAAGAELGFAVHVVEPVEVGGAVASSTAIRGHIAAGELGAARRLLGRFHDVDGRVVEGERRGRAIGFPTANLEIEGGLLPPPGIYATRVEILGDGDGRRHAAATSLGTNPTFGPGAPLTFECYLLDFDGDLYGRRLRVELVEWLRPEERFSGVDELARAIAADVARTREVINSLAPEEP
jgi:riboflavin kinase/FMN adenylyltransferase